MSTVAGVAVTPKSDDVDPIFTREDDPGAVVMLDCCSCKRTACLLLSSSCFLLSFS